MAGLLLLTYTEILPFIFAAALFSFLHRAGFGKLRLREALTSLLVPGALAALFSPVAAWKLPLAMITQFSAVVGWDPAFNILDYLALMAGFRSFFQEKTPAILVVASISTLLVMIYGLIRGPLRNRRHAAPLFLIFLFALAYFSFFMANPWNPHERGQPWSTYKAVTYAFFLFAAVYGVGLYKLWQKGRMFRLGAAVLILAYILLFPVTALKAARLNASAMREFTGVKQNPVAEYKKISQMLSDSIAGHPCQSDFFSPSAQTSPNLCLFLTPPGSCRLDG